MTNELVLLKGPFFFANTYGSEKCRDLNYRLIYITLGSALLRKNVEMSMLSNIVGDLINFP